MKKLLFLAAVAGVSLVSCVTEHEEMVKPASQQEITFEVAKYKPSETRAEVDFPTSSTFGTFAFYEDTLIAGHSTYMDNVEIMYKPVGTGIWAPKDGQYFWPTQGHLDFISYAPYNEDKSNAAVPQIDDSDVQQTFKYQSFTVDAANPVDLLYSDKALHQTANTAHYGFEGVPTLFHHALAKLNIKVKALRLDNSVSSPDEVTRWAVTINKITINGIYNEGTLTMKTTNSHGGSTTNTWTNQHSSGFNVWANTSSTTTKEWAVDQALTTTETFYGNGTATVANNYFLLPQLLVDHQQSITIDYTIVTTSPNGQVGTKAYTVTKYFNEFPAVDNWECGKNITYTIVIDPFGDEIHFAPKVVDWENVDGVISI